MLQLKTCFTNIAFLAPFIWDKISDIGTLILKTLNYDTVL